MRVLVLGAGPAGCATALLLARDGADVVVIDRDDHLPATESADEVFDRWERPAVGQLRQPHNLLGLGRSVLRSELPDVYSALLAAGAGEIDQSAFLGDAPREPGDAELTTITCRRPVLDHVLRVALADEGSVTSRIGVVSELRTRSTATGVHVSGVGLTSGETIDADLIVDASGRNSPSMRLLNADGAPAWSEQTSESKLLYYSRHYRFTGEPPAYASILGGPRGDTGYLAFAVFLGDNNTFCLTVMAPVWDPQWRELRRVAPFEAAARLLPGVASWLDSSEPMTDVLPMGQLRNVVRRTTDPDGRAPVTGLVPVGDVRCHTNPTFAFGLSLGLSQAVALRDAIGAATDDAGVVAAVERRVGDDAAARFRAVSAEDRDRVRLWSGQPIDPRDRTDSMPLFLRTVVYRAATQDSEILRAVCRRINLLDPVDRLPDDARLLDRAEELVGDLPAPAPPLREHVLSAMSGA